MYEWKYEAAQTGGTNLNLLLNGEIIATYNVQLTIESKIDESPDIGISLTIEDKKITSDEVIELLDQAPGLKTPHIKTLKEYKFFFGCEYAETNATVYAAYKNQTEQDAVRKMFEKLNQPENENTLQEIVQEALDAVTADFKLTKATGN